MSTTTEPLQTMKTASDESLIHQALKLARMQRDQTLPPARRSYLAAIHDELETRHPEVTPVMDRWAASAAPLASYTEVLVGAIRK